MNKIFFYSEDIEECIRGYRALAEEMNDELSEIRKAKCGLDEKSRIFNKTEETEEKLMSLINEANALSEILSRTKETYEAAEERIMTDTKRKLFMGRGNVIVEKELQAGQSSLLCGHTLCHDERLARMVFEKMAGEEK